MHFNCIKKELKTNKISMSVNKKFLLNKILRYRNQIFSIKGEYPSDEEISKYLDISRREVINLINTINPDSYELIFENLDTKESCQNEEESILNKLYVEKLLNQIPIFQRDRIKLFYGINCETHTMSAIAKKEGLTIQAIQSSIVVAQEKMKKIGRIKY